MCSSEGSSHDSFANVFFDAVKFGLYLVLIAVPFVSIFCKPQDSRG